ncbi:MAG: PSD1 domain-containing protein [Armatimonadetes bacterium]|nr:PSD1 domain-containing protein [Armatimonadota bacterium]MBX3108822.1 PSD1 domain-containing protein [Fimbriimonadaceae bacterium]
MASRQVFRKTISVGIALLAAVPYVVLAVSGQSPQTRQVDFSEDLMPVVRAKCMSCHAGPDAKGGLDLSAPAGWAKGGDSGPLFERGNPASSLLFERLKTQDKDMRMPQSMPALPKEQIKLFEDWIAQGAIFNLRTFERDVKPIFVRRCSTCHQGQTPAAGLDLNSWKSVLGVVDSGRPEKSVLIRRLKGLDGLEQMPKGFKAIESAELRVVEDWISQGAVQGEAPRLHWSYRPVVKPPVPKVGSNWVENPIDAFVLEKLNQEGLTPSPPASKEKLLRRLTQDLTGLPPTLAELDAFESSQETASQAIDRLLASPRFGERMATPWLDLARYADSNGYEKDNKRSIWKYRDWVVQAFNQNMPYDEFTIKQLAGDLLPHATINDLVATGFNRNTMHNLEGGVDQDEAMYQIRSDRTDTTSTVWLGQTMACARCHDHKYDPVSQEDYYRFYAFFANNKFDKVGNADISEQKYYEPSIKVPSEDQIKRLVALRSDLASAEARLKAASGDLTVEQVAWESAVKSGQVWRPVVLGTDDPRMAVQGNLVSTPGESPNTMSYDLVVTVPDRTRALRLHVLPDPTRANGGPGRSDGGNFVLSRISLSGAQITSVAADFVQNGYAPDGVLDDDPETGWAIYGAAGRAHELVIELSNPISGQVRLGLHCESARWAKHTLGKFEIEATSELGATRFAIPEPIRAIIAKANRTTEESAALAKHYERIALHGRTEREATERIKSEIQKLESEIPTTLVMAEADGKPEAPIRHRGEFLSPTEIVASGTPKAFGNPASGSRLDLAQWIVNRKNPLTARVQVNRLWEMVFGRGLVETSENFGTQGSAPSHPELLDWLAATYMESGWDTKAMLKLILSSATYQQGSAATKEKLEKDPTNMWLSRGPRFRLTAEFVRDQALAVSGLLDSRVGGPPVFPFQPEGVWDSPYSGEQWIPSTGGDATRRSLYTFWKRTAPFPTFMAFDATSREQCTVRRSRTNTPLQALATLNDPGLFLAAKALGSRADKSPGSLDDRIAWIFRTVTSRRPSKLESRSVRDYFDRTKATQGDEMAWTLVANVLLNLDEALTKE